MFRRRVPGIVCLTVLDVMVGVMSFLPQPGLSVRSLDSVRANSVVSLCR